MTLKSIIIIIFFQQDGTNRKSIVKEKGVKELENATGGQVYNHLTVAYSAATSSEENSSELLVTVYVSVRTCLRRALGLLGVVQTRSTTLGAANSLSTAQSGALAGGGNVDRDFSTLSFLLKPHLVVTECLLALLSSLAMSLFKTGYEHNRL